MNSLHLHHKLVQHVTALRLPLSQPQRTNLALWCQALAVSPNCHLATLALGLPLPGQRENLIQRLRRDLKKDELQSDRCYQPLVHRFISF
jgi:hypothetical protein